jgi:fibronectin type 3 domain-containing protein
MAEVTLLAAPGKPSVTAEGGNVTVTWEAVELADSYNIYCGTSETPPASPTQTGVVATSTTIPGLINDTPYYMWVQSVNIHGASLLSAMAEVTLLAAPGKPSVTAEGGNVTVTWKAVELADSYNVYCGTSETPPASPSQTGIVGTSTAITGLSNDAFYYVWVQAVNAGGVSSLSPVSSGTLLFSRTVNSNATFTQTISAINASSKAGNYTIVLTGDVTASDVTFTSNANKTIIIKGDASPRSISNSGNSNLFTVPAGIVLTLENNVRLNGNNKVYNAVYVNGGAFEMNDGSIINRAKASAVYVGGGTFTMKGGEISGNTTSAVTTTRGGGVYVSSGTFTKNGGGTISATNSASAGKVAYVYDSGGSKRRNTDAGPSVNLDSRIAGSAGGWE